MEIDFLKMQACGNDTIIIDCFKNPLPSEESLSHLSKAVNNRHFGVGAREMVLMIPGRGNNLRVRFFSPRGVEENVCGTAILCAGRYAYDSGVVKEKEFLVEIPRGTASVEVVDSINVQADMGSPLHSEDMTEEIRESTGKSFTQTLAVGGRNYALTLLSLGNPHAVLFVPDFNFKVHELGRQIERHPDLHSSANVEFVQMYSREELRVRVWKSGSGEAPASGTGAAASVVASVVNGFTDREVLVHMAGGDLFVQWTERSNHVSITGPAGYVFTGKYYFEEKNR